MANHTPRRLSRRLLLTDLGKAGLGIAILSSCSGSSSGGAASSPPSNGGAAGPTSASGSNAPDGSPAEATSAPDDNGDLLEWRRVSFGFVSAYLLLRGSEAAIVDTGNPDSAPAILEALQAVDAGWDSVKHVILTHNHGDHVGSVGPVLEAAPTATAYAGEADIAGIISPRPVAAVSTGDEVFGLQVISTPGHTPGSISVLDGETGLLVAGDALNGSNDGTVAGPNESFSADIDLANESVGTLAGHTFDTALFGHGDPVEGDAGEQVKALANQS